MPTRYWAAGAVAAIGFAGAAALTRTWSAVVFAGAFAIFDIAMLLRAGRRARRLRYEQRRAGARESADTQAASPPQRAAHGRSARARRAS